MEPDKKYDIESASEARRASLTILGFVLAVLSIGAAEIRAERKLMNVDILLLLLCSFAFLFFWFSFFFMDSAWHASWHSNKNRYERCYGRGLLAFRAGLVILITVPATIFYKLSLFNLTILYVMILIAIFVWYMMSHKD